MIRVRQIKIPIINDNKDTIIKSISKKLKVNYNEIINYKINKKSIDARDKNNILYVYEFDVEVLNENKILNKNKSNDILLTPNEEYNISITGTNSLSNRPIIIGSGPAGLFCSYILAELGYKPIIIERGEKIEDRINTVESFFKTNKLNTNSNIQFGEGGAGTFSDGKLNTLTHDKENRTKKVFEIFVENGAPEEIMYINKPHIGTDILRKVIVNIRNKIISLGGEFKYNSTVTDLIIDNNIISGVIINNEIKLYSNVIVLAIGHSARDTFYMLRDKNIKMNKKNFAVGVRVEHKKELIDKSQYGDSYKLLGSASYKLTYQTKSGRGVYSFCMCPGGYVVNASSEDKHLVVNGMSNYKRDEINSNSAIVVTINKDDLDNDIFSGIEFQRELEHNAYIEGNGLIPVQKYIDFKNKIKSESLGTVTPNTKGEYTLSNINNILPEYISSSIKEGMEYFNNKIKGFSSDDTLILGVESRTSSPIVIERDENYESNIKGLYPCGEGAGYAGGITTSAIDGLKIAEQIAKTYKK